MQNKIVSQIASSSRKLSFNFYRVDTRARKCGCWRSKSARGPRESRQATTVSSKRERWTFPVFQRNVLGYVTAR